MNSTKTADPESTSALAQGGDLVGVALQSAIPLECNALTVMLFWAAMDSGLRLRGIEPTGSGGLFGPCFVVWIVPSQDRNPLLRAVEQVIKEDLFFWPWENFEVAFSDRSEGYWRTIHPLGAPPFDRFLTPDNFQIARDRLGLDQESLVNGASDLRRLLRRLRGEGS